MITFKYSLKRDFPQWTNNRIIDEKEFEKELNLKEFIDKIILIIETIEDDEVVQFELKETKD